MRLFNGLAKWTVTLLLAMAAGLLVIIFLSSKPEINAYLLRIILLAAVGFLGGLIARLFYRGIPVIAAIFLSLTASLIAVLIIDHFYETGYQFQFLGNDFRLQAPNAGDVSQFILMTLVSFFPLLLFRHGSKIIPKPKKAPKVKKARKSFSKTLLPYLTKADPRNWKFWKKLKKLQITKRTPVKTAKFERPVLSIPRPITAKSASAPVTIRKNASAKPAVKKFKLPGKIFNGNPADVKLVGEEEHCCPYCLEEVVKDDSRGVKVCPECGTWHHQDCWNLTDSCGVAHRNEL
jgi:ribosomal protein L37AE/L43A